MFFEDHALLDIILDTGIDITSSTVFEIEYKKPDGTEGVWVGDRHGKTSIKYVLPLGIVAADLGEWRLQVKVNIGGRVGYGKIVTLDFVERLTSIAV